MPHRESWTYFVMWWTLPIGIACAAVWLLFSAWWLIGGESLQPLSLVSWACGAFGIVITVANGIAFRRRIRAQDSAESTPPPAPRP